MRWKGCHFRASGSPEKELDSAKVTIAARLGNNNWVTFTAAL